jgi:hypothetical protein
MFKRKREREKKKKEQGESSLKDIERKITHPV